MESVVFKFCRFSVFRQGQLLLDCLILNLQVVHMEYLVLCLIRRINLKNSPSLVINDTFRINKLHKSNIGFRKKSCMLQFFLLAESYRMDE